MSLFDLSGKSFVVTGGAGHLGSHICYGLARAGADVLCLSSKLLGRNGSIDTRICDVSNEVEFEAELKSFGPIDGLINCASRAPRGINLDMPKYEFGAALASTLTQYFTCARTARNHMPSGGSIINLASMWGLVSPSPEIYPSDLKNEPSIAMPPAAAGILQLTKYLAVLMAKDKIRVNALVPGWFPKKRGPDREDYMSEITKRIPMGRIGQPEEVVGSVIYLLSGASSYMTGQHLLLDGGYTCK